MKETVLFLDPKGTILEVIRAAKSRGFQVVALSSDTSMLSGAPAPYSSAVSLIDRVIPVDGWSDIQKIISICQELSTDSDVVGIYSGMDPCAVALAQLRKVFGLPTHSPESLSLVLNKFELRRALLSKGLSKIRNYHSDEVSKWKSWVPNQPCYFKPLHGFFSAYVKRCENFQDLVSAIKAWEAGASDEPRYVKNYLKSSSGYHLEEAFDGELLSVEGIAINGRFHVLGLLSRILYSKDPVVEMGSCFPYPHPNAEKIISMVERAHAELGLIDGPTHTEVIIDQYGEVEIIDLNPRFVGADVLQSINHALNTRIEETLLDYALGKATWISKPAKQYSCLQYFLPPEVPTLEQVSFPHLPEVKFSTTFMPWGSRISGTKRQIDYLGCYLTVMPNFEAALLRSKELRSRVSVNGCFQGEY